MGFGNGQLGPRQARGICSPSNKQLLKYCIASCCVASCIVSNACCCSVVRCYFGIYLDTSNKQTLRLVCWSIHIMRTFPDAGGVHCLSYRVIRLRLLHGPSVVIVYPITWQHVSTSIALFYGL